MAKTPPKKKRLKADGKSSLVPKANSKGKKQKKRAKKHTGFIAWFEKLLKSLIKAIVKWSIVLMIWLGIGGFTLVLYYIHDLPSISNLTNSIRKPRITIVSEDYTVLAMYGDLHGEMVDFESFPPALIDAVIATEDRRFFNHFGLDMFGVVRAAYSNYKAGRIIQGGSTITQQLAKIVFLTPERTIKRKIQEVFLALWLEYNFTKEEILTIYLNRVYLGGGNYGVDAAAHFYFNKEIEELTLREAAMLAGLLKAPSKYAPTSNRRLSEQRTKQVLNKMLDAGYITMFDIAESEYTPTMIHQSGRGILTQRYVTDWIIEQIPHYVGRFEKDITVVTTIDPYLQQRAEHHVERLLDNVGEQKHIGQAALVSLSPAGEVRAMVGGRNYSHSQFNRAVNAYRQPGSAFKLFVYLAAMQAGMSPEDIVEDAPITVHGWSPQNYTKTYQGEVSLRDAFAESINTVAVKIAQKVGVRNIKKLYSQLGLSSELPYNLTIALGAGEASLLELTGGYAHLANHGNAVWVHAISAIAHSDDNKVLYQREKTNPPQMLKAQTVAYMNDLLIQVMKTGTGKSVRINRPVAGKTGTSQDFRDAWFIGYTPQLVTGVWVGNDDNTPMNKVTGGTVPAQLWNVYMEDAVATYPQEAIPRQAKLVEQMQRKDEYKTFWNQFSQ